MNLTTRILIVEDDPDDYDLAQVEIHKVVQACTFQRVEKQNDFLEALQQFEPHIILSDYKLPGFDGIKVLELAHQHIPLSPVIIWTGVMGEEMAVDCMKAGAFDYILKENIRQLGHAVLQALKEREVLLERAQAQEKYRAIFENSPVGIFQSTPQGQFLSVNPAMARIYGYASPQEMIDSITDIAHQIYTAPEDRLEFINLIESQQVVENFEWKNTRKDGSIFWTSTSARAVYDDAGNVSYYEGFLRDITDWKLGDAKLRESEARYHGIFENAQDAIFVESFEGDILDVNQRACEMFGYTRQELLQKKVKDLIPAQGQPAYLPSDGSSIGQTIEAVNIRANGEHFPVELRGGLYEAGGRRLLLIVLRDITERKQAEEKLRDQEKRFRVLIEHGMDNISLIAENGTLLWEDPSLNIVLGYGKGEFIGRSLFELLHPEDLPWVTELFTRLVHDPGRIQDATFRLKHSDGTWRWIEATATNMLDEPSVKAVVINYRDITKRKRAEEALSDSEAKYRTLAENSLQGIAIFQKQRIVYVNPAMCTIMGYTAEELLEMSENQILALTHPDDRAVAMERATKRQAGGPVSSLNDVRIIRKDGTIRWIQTFANSIEYNGQPAILSTGLDITERKQTEVELQQKNEDLALLNKINGAIIQGQDLDSIIELLSNELKRIFSTVGSTIYLLAPDQQSITMHQYSFSAETAHKIEKLIGFKIPKIQIPIKQGGHFHRAMISKQSAITSDPKEIQSWIAEFVDTKFLPAFTRAIVRKLVPQITKLLNIKSTIIIPLIFEEEILGFLDVSSTYLFTANDLKRIESIGEQLTSVLQRQQANERIRKSEEFLQNVQNSLSAHVAILNQQGEVVQVNRAWCEFGAQNGLQSENGCVGVNYLSICESATGSEKEAAQQVAEAIREVLGGQRKESSVEYACHSPEEKRWFTVHITCFDDGQQKWVILAHENITERKRAEEALRQQEQSFRTLTTNLPDIISRFDRELKYVYANPIISVSTGLAPEALLGKTNREVGIRQDLAAQWENALQHVFETGKPATVEFTLPGIDTMYDFEGRLVPEFSSEGTVETVLAINRDITERKHAEETLRESEALYRQAIEVAGAVPYYESYYDEGRLIKYEFIGEGIRQITGYGPDEFSAPLWDSLIEEINLVGDLAGYSLDEGIQRVRTGKNSIWQCEHRIRARDGKVHWVFEAAVELRDESGVAYGSIGTYQDITERKRAEAAEREQRVLAEALRDTSQILSGSLDYGEVLDHILAAVGNVVPHDAATIMLIDGDVAHVVRSQGYQERDPDTTVMEVRLPLAETINLRQMLETKQPVVVYDTHSFPGWQRLDTIDWLRSNVGAPISVYGEVIGFILLDSRTPAFFTPVHAERLEAFANQAALAIHNANLLKQAQDEIAERKRAEESLRAERKKMQDYLDIAGVMMLALDRQGTVTLINQKGCEILGYSAEEVIGRNWIETFLPAEIRSELLGVFETLAVGETASASYYENPVLTKNGEQRVIAWHNTLLRDAQGMVISTLSSGEDITERKQIEAKLQASESRYRLATQATKDVIWEWNAETNRLLWTENAQIAFGYSPEDVGPDALWWDEHIHPEDRERVQSSLYTLTASESHESVWLDEYRFLLKDGSYAYINDHAYIERDSSGKAIRMIGAMSNITERKRAEQELRTSEERFRQLATNIEEAFWMTDARTGQELYISPAAAAIWGKSVEYMLNTPDAFIHSVLPEDRAEVLAALENQKRGEKTEIEYRVQHLDGSVRWVWDRAFPIFDEKGRVKILAGIAADITKRKLSEERLRASEERYHSLFQHLTDGFALHEIIANEQGKPVDYRFLEVNPAFEKLTGLRAESTVGRRVNEILPRVGNEHLIAIYGKVALTGEPIHFEEYSAPLGRYYEINAYSPRHGQFAVTFEDITERRQAEANLRKLSRAVEQSASTIVITDIAGNIEYVNPKFTETTGYTFEEAVGQNPRILKTGHTSLEEYKRLWETITAGDEWRGELFNRKKNGDLFWEQATISPIQNEQGEITHFIAVKEDITQRKQSEAETQRHLAELQAVYENGLAVGQLLEPRQIGERLIETFARHLSWHHVTIRLLRPETDEMELIAFNLPDLDDTNRIEAEAHFERLIHKVGQGLSGYAVQTGTAIRTGQVRAHPQYVSTQAGIQSGLYMPLKIGNRVIGVISVESGEADAFTEQDQRLLATLATQAAIAFENARLYQAAQQEISERERAQAALRESEAHYRELADSITEIMFELDQDLHCTHWNKASEIFSGIPAQDAIGRSMRDVFGESEDQSYREKIYRRVLTERQAQTFETEALLHGQRRILEINAYPSARGVSVVARDITERRLSEALQQKRIALMEYSARHALDDLMQRALDEVSELTDSHIGFLHFVEADQRAIRLQAWSSETLAVGRIGEKGMHYPVESAGIWADAVRQGRPTIHNDYESLPNKNGLPDGHVRVIRELVVPIIRDDRIAAVLGIGNKSGPYDEQDIEITERFADYAWDIIERKQMESALSDERNQLAQRVDERTADLSRANSNLARALRVKDEFLANMSHELRTPLNAILGLSESLSEQVAGPLNEKQQKYLNTINESGHHLLSLINDILDLAKIEAGQITLDINKVDINSVCQASLRMIKQLAQKKNQDVLFEIDNGLGLMWADERRLKQMIVNLLSNAVKFTPENGRLGLEVHGDQAGNRVLITIWDKGIGISNQNLERLFRPFVQLDSGLAREATGTGLGLALVAQMARLHGGSVSVDSQPGEGSRFTIQLPWEPALAADVSSRLRTSGKFRAIDIHAKNKPTILLIEDTREVVMMLADYLEMAGFTIATAQDGIEGLEQAKLKHPDLILMDIQMPRMDGFETTQKLRLITEFKETPIIALTALAMPHDRQRCLDAGMSEYISKPVNLKMLLKLIRGILYEKEGNPT